MSRGLEAALAAVALIVALPVLALVALAVLLMDGTPVLFQQERVGMGAKPFRLLKFRTMRSAAGAKVTVSGDPRITSLGRFLRKCKLDELPQLFNVLAGQMSFVGPRPEVSEYVALYTPEQREVLSVRPGITDPASIEFRHESEILARATDWRKAYIEEILPKKLELSRTYLKRRTLASDIGVILRTARVLFIKNEPGARL